MNKGDTKMTFIEKRPYSRKKVTTNIRFIVVHKEFRTKIIRSFQDRAEANHFITDCFGPDASQYEILVIDMRAV